MKGWSARNCFGAAPFFITTAVPAAASVPSSAASTSSISSARQLAVGDGHDGVQPTSKAVVELDLHPTRRTTKRADSQARKAELFKTYQERIRTLDIFLGLHYFDEYSREIAEAEERLQALKDAGLRDRVKVMVGGAPITEEFAEEIGADGTAADAAATVTLAKKLLA